MGTFEAVAATYDAWYATLLGQLTDELEKAAVFTLVPTRERGARP